VTGTKTNVARATPRLGGVVVFEDYWGAKKIHKPLGGKKSTGAGHSRYEKVQDVNVEVDELQVFRARKG